MARTEVPANEGVCINCFATASNCQCPDYISYSSSKGPGRPAKGYTELHCKVPTKTKAALEKIADGFGISNGEAVAILVDSYQQNIKRTLSSLE